MISPFLSACSGSSCPPPVRLSTEIFGLTISDSYRQATHPVRGLIAVRKAFGRSFFDHRYSLVLSLVRHHQANVANPDWAGSGSSEAVEVYPAQTLTELQTHPLIPSKEFRSFRALSEHL